jgi:hypothetical protein
LQGVRPDGTSRLSQNFLTSALSGSGGLLSFARSRSDDKVAPEAATRHDRLMPICAVFFFVYLHKE